LITKRKSIGHGFADEIFQIFRNNHPDARLSIENVSDVLQPMINVFIQMVSSF